MHEYRATVTYNSLLLHSRTLTAGSDEAARAMQPELDAWATDTMRETGEQNSDDPADFPDAIVTVDRLDAHGVMEDEIYYFRHSGSHPFSTDLLAFAQRIARLTLFAESDHMTGRPEGMASEDVQTDLDWVIAQDETLESLIHEARMLIGVENHPPPETS